MTTKYPDDDRSVNEQILDLLLDALLERQAVRRVAARAAAARATAGQTEEPVAQRRPEKPESGSSARQPPPSRPMPKVPRAPKPGDEGWQPPDRVPSIDLQRTLGRLLAFLAVVALLINVPITRYGVSLARIMPDSASLIIRDGLLVKGDGPEVFVLEDEKLRWISSLDAFEHLGLFWDDVRTVDDAFLERYDRGEPIHVLLKCVSSPHVYRLEGMEKRWIKDIPTFEREGHVWENVHMVDCSYLRRLPDGLPIPEDAGPPPQP